MHPLNLVETTPGNYSLLLNAGTTPVEDVLTEIGREANGYFWEDVAEMLAGEEAGKFQYDSEAGMFCAYGSDRAALAVLGDRMAALAHDPERVRSLFGGA